MRPDANRSTLAPSVDDVRRIAAIANPVIRNLEITQCYSRLAAAFAARSGEGANWCTYATWASRQAGRTIRGEDLLEHLGRRLGRGPLAAASDRDAVAPAAAPRPLPARDADRAPDGRAAHAVRRVRACQRRRRARQPEGVRGDRAGVRALSPRCPPDAPADSPALQRFLDGLRPGDPPEGQRFLRQAFARYERCGSNAIRRGVRSSPSSRTSRSASTSRRACSRRSSRHSTPRPPRRRIWAAGARGALSVGTALVAGRPASGRRRRRRRGGSACSGARAGSRARRSPTRSWSCRCRGGCWRSGRTCRRVPGGARPARRPGADRAAGAVRAGYAGARRLRRARLVGAPAADALHRRTCSARST